MIIITCNNNLFYVSPVEVKSRKLLKCIVWNRFQLFFFYSILSGLFHSSGGRNRTRRKIFRSKSVRTLDTIQHHVTKESPSSLFLFNWPMPKSVRSFINIHWLLSVIMMGKCYHFYPSLIEQSVMRNPCMPWYNSLFNKDLKEICAGFLRLKLFNTAGICCRGIFAHY